MTVANRCEKYSRQANCLSKGWKREGRETTELSRNRKEFSMTGVYKVEYKERKQELKEMCSESREFMHTFSSTGKTNRKYRRSKMQQRAFQTMSHTW